MITKGPKRYYQWIYLDKPVNLINFSNSKKYNLPHIEDCAQSFGATYKTKQTGSYGDLDVLAFPTKNLGCFGMGPQYS